MTLADVPVTIIGGGPVGLAMSVALSRQGIASRVLDLKAATTDHPKARGVWARAMEIFRQLGVEERIRAGGLPDRSDSFTLMDGLENELCRSAPEPVGEGVLARKCVVSQDVVEDALVWRLKDHPDVDVRWLTEFLAADDEGDQVRVEAKDLRSGETLTWRTRYVIGADGGAGICAKAAGIEYERTPILATMLNTYFRADLSEYAAAANSGVLLLRIDAKTDPVGILNTNGTDRWLMLRPIGREADERARPATDAETIAYLQRVLRRPDLEVAIINEAIWRVTRRIALNFRNGRFFLVGDAAHRFPPTGGFGMNSGIEDIHNLAWKLAFVLRGEAGEGLLDSYEQERRPVAHANAELAFQNYARQPQVREALKSADQDRMRFWVDDLANHTTNVGHVLGFVYGEGAFIPDGSTRPPHTPTRYTPTDRPGSRYPHIWLDAAHAQSTHDLVERNLVLMVGEDASDWAAAARSVAQALAIPLAVQVVTDPEGRHGLKIGPHGAALVRPDGVTAWRIAWRVSDPAQALRQVVETVLARSPA